MTKYPTGPRRVFCAVAQARGMCRSAVSDLDGAIALIRYAGSADQSALLEARDLLQAAQVLHERAFNRVRLVGQVPEGLS